MKTNVKQNFMHLMFTIVCMALVQFTAMGQVEPFTDQMTYTTSYGGAQSMPIDNNSVELAKIIIQGVIGLAHVLVSWRNDRRHKREVEREQKAALEAQTNGTK